MCKSTAVIFILGFSLLFKLEKLVSNLFANSLCIYLDLNTCLASVCVLYIHTLMHMIISFY